MRSAVAFLLITPISAGLAQVCNPLVRLSPVHIYGMQERYPLADLAVIVGAVVAAKILLVGVKMIWGKGIAGRILLWRFLASTVAISAVAVVMFLFTTISASPNFLIYFCLFEWVLSAGIEWIRPENPGRVFSIKRVLWPVPGSFWAMAFLAIATPALLGTLAWSYRKFPAVKSRVNSAQNLFRRKGDYGFETVLGELSFRQLIDFDIDRKTGDLFVLERAGRLFRVGPERADKVLLADFRSEVGPPPVGELGAYSVKLDPLFGEGANRKLYLFHTSRTEATRSNSLVELDLSRDESGDIWERRRVLLSFPATGTSHNSGALDFDEEGFMFVGLGDIESPPDSLVLNGSLTGKILRIDPAKTGGAVSREPELPAGEGVTRNYFIPLTNPFTGDEEIHGEIWAYGIRNPFRIRWEPNLKALIVGDVGQLEWEELNLVRAGDNCGWPAFEGRETYEEAFAKSLKDSEVRNPFYAYRHDALNRSIVGGYFYEGTDVPGINGSLLAGDNFSGNVWAIRADGRGEPALLAKAPDFNQSGIGKIMEGAGGEIWIAVMGSMTRDTGSIYRLVKSASPAEDVSVAENRSPDEVFATYCVICHGPAGDGRSAMAREFPIVMPDFSSAAWHKTVTDEELGKAIAEGGLAVGKSGAMPAWGSVFSESEVERLVAFVRSLEL